MIKISTGETYIPTWNGNDKAEKPIRVKIKYLNAEDREQCEQLWLSNKVTKRGVYTKPDLSEYFKRGVVEFENLSVEVDGKPVDIKTVSDYLAYPLPVELYQEIAFHIRDTSGVDIKN